MSITMSPLSIRVCEKFGKLEDVMRSEDQIHKPVTLLQLLHDLRLPASCSRHRAIIMMRILLLDSAELSKTSVYSLVRIPRAPHTYCR